MAEVATTANSEKRKRTRSPAFPYINLETAIARAKEFYDEDRRNAANINVALKHWGFKEDSSIGAQTVAAVISFGLLQNEGVGDKRKVRLTQDALRILLDERPDSKERAELIRQAALAPKIHQQLWERWGNNLPSDAQLRHTLLLEWPTPFNENAVDGFIREYRDTISFARLSESDTVASEVNNNGDGGGAKSAYIPKVGDYVQWESRGVLQFPEPKRVREVDADGKFVFVEGGYTSLPVGELSRAKAPSSPQYSSASVPETRIPSSPNMRMQEDVFSLAEGRATFQWPTPLSEDSIADLKDWIKILERKISRSATRVTEAEQENS